MPIKDRGTYREIFEVEGCDISNYLLLPKQDALQTPKPIIRDSKPNDLKIIDEYDFIKVNIKLSPMKWKLSNLLVISVSNNALVFVVFEWG